MTTAEEMRERLDAHVRSMVAWHFSEETGTPFWLAWAKEQSFDPRSSIRGFSDLLQFPHFDGDVLRSGDVDQFIPRGYAGKPYRIFESGGSTGVPHRRLSWNDHRTDYDAFSKHLPKSHFPEGATWLMVGPTGPRRIRLTIEYLAQVRGGRCFHVDLDARWARTLMVSGRHEQFADYKAHILKQAVSILETTPIQCLFITPSLLEGLDELWPLGESAITGIMCGGTSMTAQTVRFLTEEVLGSQTRLFPTYGNTLMGVAPSLPIRAEDGFQLNYYPPVPRAVLRVVNPDDPSTLVDYGQVGRVELTTLTREFFMPRYLERDEAIRLEPCAEYPYDGVGQVRPLGSTDAPVAEGVY